MVTFRVFWIRNQECPLSEEEAVQSGAVVQQEIVDEQLGGFQAGDQAGNPDGPLPAENIGDEVSETAGMAPEPADDTAEIAPAEDAGVPQAAALPPIQPQTRLAYILSDTGAEVTPGSPGWPTKLCTRQITEIVGAKIVDDRECEFADIPILHNVNIPMPGARPYGMGEPYRLKGLQQALSDSLDSMVVHQRHFAHPVTFMTDSMMTELASRYGDAYIKPGRVIGVPDDLAMALGGKFDFIQEPPPMSPAASQLVPMLQEMIQQQSGNTEVIQGRASSQIRSGRAIEMLQSAATSMIGFKSQRTGDMVRRLARLMLHSIVWRLDVDDLYKIVSKYPRHVLQAIHDRAREIEWNVTINIEAGTGALKMQKAQMAMEQRAQGLISEQTTLEECERDKRVEDQRKMAEMQKMARAGMLQQPGQEQGAQEQSNGNPGQ